LIGRALSFTIQHVFFHEAPMIRCPKCGHDNANEAAYCQHCGAALGSPYLSPQAVFEPAPVPSAGNDTVATVIPYKNVGALIAYYLGLFSCFPVLGFPLAIIALVFGIRGLRAVRANPIVHGTAHAWVGLICGTIGFLINLLIISGIVMAILVGDGR
jgi:hypothetical protein